MNTLSQTEVKALHEALDDEYRSWATYDQVISDFGEVRPFSNIRDAEARHIEALSRLFAAYGLPVPANPWPGRTEHYASVQQACAAAVDAEIDNGEMYERLLGATTREDILTVFRSLQQASVERHLEAFRRCAERRSGSGGRGPGRRV